MTLQGNLQLNFNGQTYLLAVKSILLKGVYYFFIHELDEVHQLLSGETLQLVYSGEFINPAEVEGSAHKIAPEIITAIEAMLMENKELWYY